MASDLHYYLAVDLGASGGRHILGHVEHGRMVLEEVYRFPNGITRTDGQLCWDCENLFRQIKAGMCRCRQLGKIPVSMSVDTWGVDFVLLDWQGNRLGNAVSYRDDRTRGMEAQVFALVPEQELFERTGVARYSYNTIYQLMALRRTQPRLLDRADTMLMSPDYYHWRLTGMRAAEYTIATTSQLVNRDTNDWDWDVIRRLDLPPGLFCPISRPGTALGSLSREVRDEVGFDCTVVLPCSHDTASAVFAVPAPEDCVFLSSGTWSLMGVELPRADRSPESFRAGFSNEGGYGGTSRFLKNIMGLWMIQRVREELGSGLSYEQLCQMAEQAKDFPSRVDVDDVAFFAPDSMVSAIQTACRSSGQPVPETPGQLACVIYHSLADCYARTVRQIEEITGHTYPAISILGGGSNADLLNRLTAQATGKTVYAGPAEATAIGNLAVQMLHDGVFETKQQAKDCIFQSFAVKKFSGMQEV